jgi:4-amino-4-deoxychorismate lyase
VRWADVDTDWLVNGQPGYLDPGDRGLAYGDGLFETMAADSGAIRWLDYHLERLRSGCRRLKIPAPDEAVLRREIAECCPPAGKAVVKLIVTRGTGARGYRPPDDASPTRLIGTMAWPARPAANYSTGIELIRCEMRLGRNPALAGLKHLNRLEQVLARAELPDDGAWEGLLLDSDGDVVGCTSSNIFAISGRRLITPETRFCGVEGVMRRIVIETAAELRLEASDTAMRPETLLAADALFVTNAVFGIWPVRRFGERAYARSPIIRELQAALGYGADA